MNKALKGYRFLIINKERRRGKPLLRGTRMTPWEVVTSIKTFKAEFYEIWDYITPMEVRECESFVKKYKTYGEYNELSKM